MTTSVRFLKLMNVVGNLYHEDPEIFEIKFRGFYTDVKFHNRLRKICKGDKTYIRRFYAAISKFDEYEKKYKEKYKKVNYQLIYENVSDSYKIPIDLLKSAVGSRNSFKRDPLK
jgi:hypothetical protein